MKNIFWALFLCGMCVSAAYTNVYMTSHQKNVIHVFTPMHTIVSGDIETNSSITTVGVEGIMDASAGRLASFDKPFLLHGRSVEKFQATISYRTDAKGCSPQALMVVSVNGVDAYRAITKLTQVNTATTVFVNYDFPLPIGEGDANLHVEADGGCTSDWEIQGAMISN